MLDLLIAALLGSFAFAVYHTLGLEFLQTRVFNFNDIMFGSDFSRFIGDLTVLEASHHRTGVHPFFTLIFNPIGRFFTERFGSQEIASLVICNFFGALCIAVFYLILRRLKINRLLSFVFTAIYSFSATALLWSSVPESFAISSFGAMLLFFIYLSNLRGRTFYPLYGLASLFAFGVLTTNIVPIVILLWAHMRKKGERSKLSSDLLKLAVFTFFIIGIAAILASLQKSLYPSSLHFLDPQTYAREFRLFIYYEIVDKPLLFFTQVLPHFFTFNFVAPGFFATLEPKPLVSFDYSLFGAFPKIVVFTWCAWLVWSTALMVKRKIYLEKILWALFAFEIFYVALHSFYGVIEQFLYSLHYAFGVLLVFALPYSELQWKGNRLFYLLALLLLFLAFGFELAANIGFIDDTLLFLFGNHFQAWVSQS